MACKIRRWTATPNLTTALVKWPPTYLEGLREVQPQGPYLLGGYSFGGLVAFEMAQQLRRQGQEIAAAGHARQHVASQWQAKFMISRVVLGVDDSLILFLDAKEQARQTGKEFTVSAAELQRLGDEDRTPIRKRRDKTGQTHAAGIRPGGSAPLPADA